MINVVKMTRYLLHNDQASYVDEASLKYTWRRREIKNEKIN